MFKAAGNWFIYIYCFMLVFASCKNQSASHKTPLNYFKIMHVADSLSKLKNDSTCLRYIGSFYNPARGLTVMEKYQEYDLKRHFFYEDRHNFIMANLYADSMLTVLKGREHDEAYIKNYSNACHVKGDALLALKRYNQAFQYYYQGKLAAAQIKDRDYNGGYNAEVGLNCYRQGKFKEAANYFKLAYQERILYVPKSNDELRQQLAIEQKLLDDVGLSFSKTGMPDSAMAYFKKTLVAINRLGERFLTHNDSVFTQSARGVVYGNWADVYQSLGDTAMARSLWERSIMINIQPGYDNHDAMLTQLKLAGLYISANHLAEATPILEQLATSIKNTHDENSKLKWLKLEWDYLDKKGRVKQAFTFGNNYLRLKDSLNTSDINNASVDMVESIKVLEQQRVNESLKKANTLKQLYLFIALLVAGAASFIAFLIGQNWKRSRRNIALLTELNQQISKHNDQMQEALNALEQSQKENTRMMKIVAHDLRNPVGNMTAIAGMLLEQPELSSEQRELLELLQTSGENSLDLIGNLLQANSRQENLSKEPVDIYLLLNYCVALMKFKANEKNQQIHLQSGHITLMLCREKMWRVISNLIGNAIKFSPENSVINIHTEEKPATIMIIIKDNGIGIPVDSKEKIFDMYTIPKRKGTAGEETFGMGLAIAKQIIEAHEGKIWFDSEPNKGTTFFIELPKIKEQDSPPV